MWDGPLGAPLLIFLLFQLSKTLIQANRSHSVIHNHLAGTLLISRNSWRPLSPQDVLAFPHFLGFWLQIPLSQLSYLEVSWLGKNCPVGLFQRRFGLEFVNEGDPYPIPNHSQKIIKENFSYLTNNWQFRGECRAYSHSEKEENLPMELWLIEFFFWLPLTAGTGESHVPGSVSVFCLP